MGAGMGAGAVGRGRTSVARTRLAQAEGLESRGARTVGSCRSCQPGARRRRPTGPIIVAVGHGIFPFIRITLPISISSTQPIRSCTIRDTSYITRILSPIFFFRFLPSPFHPTHPTLSSATSNILTIYISPSCFILEKCYLMRPFAPSLYDIASPSPCRLSAASPPSILYALHAFACVSRAPGLVAHCQWWRC